MGPSQIAASERGSPIATNGGSAKLSRLSQHFAMTSGPMPAGSPSETASGARPSDAISRASLPKTPRLAEFDHRVAPEVAQIALRARVDPLFIELVVDIVVARRRGGNFVAAAKHERADAFLERSERLGRLPDLH